MTATLATTTLAWRTDPKTYRLSILVKATFALKDGDVATQVEATPFTGDVHYENDPRRTLAFASDYVPRKAKVDVLFHGKAYAPMGGISTAREVRFALLREGMIVFDKSLRVVGDRRRDETGAPTAPRPFTEMPIRWELAYGGASFADNPIGVGHDPNDPRLPSIVDVKHTDAPAGLAPIPNGWPARARSLGGLDPASFATALPIVPTTFDFAYFNAAPLDQRVAKLVGDEEIELDGLHPALSVMRSRLPGLTAEITLSIGREARTMKTVADTLVVDGDKLLVSITYRADLEVTAEIAQGKVVPQITARLVAAAIPAPAAPLAPPKPAPIAATQQSRTKPPSPQRVGPAVAATQRAPRRATAASSTRWFAGTRPQPDAPIGGGGPLTLTMGRGGSKPASLRGTSTAGAVKFSSTIAAPEASFPALVTSTRAPKGHGAWSFDDAPPPAPIPSAPVAAPGAPAIDPSNPMAAYFAALQKKGRRVDDDVLAAPEPPPVAPDVGVPVARPRFLTMQHPELAASIAPVAEHVEEAPQVIVDDVLPPPVRTTEDVPIVRATPLEVVSIQWSLRPPNQGLVVIVKGTFAMVDGAPARFADEQATAIGDVHWDDDPSASVRYPSDLAPFKPAADVMLVGHGYPGSAGNVGAVSMRFGELRRRIGLFGARSWARFGPTDPQPFDRIPLRLERAFGGPASQENPHGVGFKSNDLPNLEDPNDLLKTRASVALPAYFGPIPPSFRVRRAKVGTYDAAWQRDRWPWLPDDFDWAYFNAAPIAQQIEYPKGDERYELLGVSPSGAIAGALPGIRPRVFAQLGAEANGAFLEILVRLDTIFFDADARTITLVWRGLLEVADREASEVAAIFATHESPGDAPLSLEAARAKMNAQTMRKGLARLGAKEPHDAAAIAAALLADPIAGSNADAANDPPAIEAPPPAPAITREEVIAALDAGETLAERDLTGVDLSAIDLAGRDLHDAVLKEANLVGARLDGANLAGANLAGADARRASFVEADLSRADLTGAALDGADFSAAIATRATFSDAFAAHARFRKANAKSARFVGAALTESDFEGADVTAADFTKATIDRARFVGAQLADAKLYEAIGAGASLDGAKMANVRADGVILSRASLRNVEAPSSNWEGADLLGANLDSAILTGATFQRATVDGANMNRTDLVDAVFRKARLRETRFLRANLMRAIFERADLAGADLRGANLYQAETWDAKLGGVHLEQADVTGTKLA